MGLFHSDAKDRADSLHNTDLQTPNMKNTMNVEDAGIISEVGNIVVF